jgi:HEPN domain-containing protein
MQRALRGTGMLWEHGRVAERSKDWLRQAEADLAAARHARAGGHHEWAAFGSQQAAEKALKALYQKLHLDAWGHVLTDLLGQLPEDMRSDGALVDAAKALDKHYIPTRYPNGFERGAPADFYTATEADRALADAERIIDWCRRQINR